MGLAGNKKIGTTILKGSFGILSIFGIITAIKKVAKKSKKGAEARRAREQKSLIIECDNSNIEKFTKELTAAIQKDFDTLDIQETKTREIIKELYANQISSVLLLRSVSVKKQKGADKARRSENFKSIIWPSVIMALSSIGTGLYFLKSKLGEMLNKDAIVSISFTLLCFIISLILISVTVVKHKLNIKDEIKLNFDVAIADEEKDRIVGKNFQKVIDKLHSQTESIRYNQSLKLSNDNQELLKSLSEIYAELFEAVKMNDLATVKGDVLPSMKLFIKNSLHLEIQDNYTDETQGNFTIQKIDGPSFVLQPAIINPETGKVESRGVYAKGNDK